MPKACYQYYSPILVLCVALCRLSARSFYYHSSGTPKSVCRSLRLHTLVWEHVLSALVTQIQKRNDLQHLSRQPRVFQLQKIQRVGGRKSCSIIDRQGHPKVIPWSSVRSVPIFWRTRAEIGRERVLSYLNIRAQFHSNEIIWLCCDANDIILRLTSVTLD